MGFHGKISIATDTTRAPFTRSLFASLLAIAVLAGAAFPAHGRCDRPLIKADRLDKAGGRQSFSIPSDSSFPTVQRGQTVKSARVTSGFQPRVGDMVVYVPATGKQVTYLKRVVAVGPTTVQMRNGRLFIGGKQVARTGPLPWPTGLIESAKTQCQDSTGKPAAAKLYQETLPGGARYRIVECAGNQRGSDDTAEIKVPAGHYFMLGDNRDNSDDSRFQGPVPASRITHIATCVRDSFDLSVPLIMKVLYIALGVLLVVFLGLLLVFWRRRQARDTA